MGKLKHAGLVCAGMLGGILISLQLPALAEKEDVRNRLPIEDLRIFAEVFNAIKQGYVEEIDDKKLITHAISGMLGNLDPHSSYLDAGIKTGDLIFKIDNTLVKGLTLSDAVKRMRGKPKTRIKLSIMRKGEVKPIELTLTREIIKVRSVKSKLVEKGYGYLRITSFQESTGAVVAKHLTDLYKEGALKGLVLDLRNDPGGLLNSAVGVAAAFLPPKSLVTSTDGRAPDSKHKFFATPEDYLRGTRDDYLRNLPPEVRKVPIVVLINGGSASASEIVAGALQDHKRAIVMGTTSFGKGSVQTVLPLPSNTAIKLTTARYFTPSGRSIQAKGIEPDIVVEESPNGNSSSSMRLREADLEHHLANGKEEKAQTPAPDKSPQNKTSEKTKSSSPKNDKDDNSRSDDQDDAPITTRELASKKDYQFMQALNLLKGLQIIQPR